jgi:hypothetical protein
MSVVLKRVGEVEASDDHSDLAAGQVGLRAPRVPQCRAEQPDDLRRVYVLRVIPSATSRAGSRMIRGR